MSEVETFVAYKEHRDSQTCVLLKTDQYEDVCISEVFKALNKRRSRSRYDGFNI